MLSRLETLDKDRDILSYIVTAVRNFSIDEYRKVRVRRRKETPIDFDIKTKLSGVSHTVEFIIEDITDSEQESAILSKIVFDNMKPDDVAKELDIDKKDMKTFLSKIKTKLTTC